MMLVCGSCIRLFSILVIPLVLVVLIVGLVGQKIKKEAIYGETPLSEL